MILLRFDIEQTVDGNHEVIPPDIVIMNGYHDALLFLRCVTQQRLHPLFQASVIFDADRECCNDNAYNDCPIQEDEEQLERDGITEDE